MRDARARPAHTNRWREIRRRRIAPSSRGATHPPLRRRSRAPVPSAQKSGAECTRARIPRGIERNTRTEARRLGCPNWGARPTPAARHQRGPGRPRRRTARHFGEKRKSLALRGVPRTLPHQRGTARSYGSASGIRTFLLPHRAHGISGLPGTGSGLKMGARTPARRTRWLPLRRGGHASAEAKPRSGPVS